MPNLQETVARMSAEGIITKEREAHINLHLDGWVKNSRYTLLNLGTHMSIGFVRFSIPFLPVGSVLRVLWTSGNMVFYSLARNRERREIHSFPVLLLAAVPFFGYFAYTIPLKKKNEYLAYLYSQHISYKMHGKALEKKLEEVPAFLRKIAYTLLVPATV